MNIENLRDPSLWEYVGRRITTLGSRVGIFDLDREGDAIEAAAIVCEILANTVYGTAEEWRPPPRAVAVPGLRIERWVWQYQRSDDQWVDMHPHPFNTRAEAESAYTPPDHVDTSTSEASQTRYRLVGRADVEVVR